MKKILSIILCVAMLVPMCTVFPVSAEYEEDEIKFFGPDEQFWYQLTSEGELYVSGNGPLPDIHFADCKYDVVTAEITGGISSVCYGAFKDCTKLREVKFTDEELWDIYEYAFETAYLLKR